MTYVFTSGYSGKSDDSGENSEKRLTMLTSFWAFYMAPSPPDPLALRCNTPGVSENHLIVSYRSGDFFRTCVASVQPTDVSPRRSAPLDTRLQIDPSLILGRTVAEGRSLATLDTADRNPTVNDAQARMYLNFPQAGFPVVIQAIRCHFHDLPTRRPSDGKGRFSF